MDALKEFFIKVSFDTSGFDKLRDNLNNLQKNIKQSVGNGTKATTQNLTAMTTTLKGTFSRLADNIKGTFERLFSGLKRQNKEYADSTKSMLNNLKNLFIGYLSFATIQGSIKDFVDRGMLADEASSLLGITPERFDNIAKAFNRFGVEATSMESQLSAFNKQIQQADKGTGRLKQVLENFGLTIYNSKGEIMDADEMLLSMSEQLKDFDGKTRGAILAMMGFDNSIQSAFSDGGEALMSFYKKQKELNIITEKDTKLAKKWTFQLKDLKDQITRIRNAIARFLLPIITKIAEILTKFIEWIFKHKQAFLAILIAIGVALKPILATIIILIAKMTALLAPWIALGALIAGIVLVFEDIYYYFKGYNSVIGKFVKKWQFLASFLNIFKPLIIGIGTVLDDIINFFKEPNFDNFTAIFENIFRAIIIQFQKIGDIVINLFAEIYDNWQNIDWLETFNQLFNFDWWSEKLNNVLNWFKDIFIKVGDFFKEVFNNILDWFNEKIQAVIAPIKKVGEKVGDFIDGAVDTVNSAWEGTKDTVNSAWEGTKDLMSDAGNSIKSFFGFGDDAPVATSNNYATTNNTSNQQIHINAYGVTNENADKLGKSVGDQVNSAIYQNGNTGRF